MEEHAAAFMHHREDCATGGDHDHIKGRKSEVKKVNHNASERQRRKKINELYTSLRLLLPASQQMKRMSIPKTVAEVIKYIPELQDQVARMEKQKQAISKKINRVQKYVCSLLPILTNTDRHCQKSATGVSSVSTNRVGDTELVIHISAIQVSICRILSGLEADEFQVISASSSETLCGSVILNLHLQKQFGIQKTNCKAMDENIISMLEQQRR